METDRSGVVIPRRAYHSLLGVLFERFLVEAEFGEFHVHRFGFLLQRLDGRFERRDLAAKISDERNGFILGETGEMMRDD